MLTLVAAGCQSSLVPVRQMSYEGHFEVNGARQAFSTTYHCYYERLSSFSQQGSPWWHVRGTDSLAFAHGVLADGRRYQVMPLLAGGAEPAQACEEVAEPVRMRVFLSLPDGRVESFDRAGRSAHSLVAGLESRFVLQKTDLAPFLPQHEWPQQQRASHRYYAIWTLEFGRENWSDPAGAGLADFIRQRRVPLLESGAAYPFEAWSDEDALFARAYRGALRWPVLRLPLTPDAGQLEIWRAQTTESVQWVPEPAIADERERWVAPMQPKFKRWVLYRGARIEVPITDYYRVLYDAERDRLVMFRVAHVSLW